MTNKLLIFALLLLLYSCKDNTIEPVNINYDTGYFPIEKGFYKVFKGKSIVIDTASNVYDTTDYFIKEIQTEWVADAIGDSVMRIERHFRENENARWEPMAVWSASIKDRNAIQTEENIKYVKIKFPVKAGNKWDGNIYNTIDLTEENTYEVLSIDAPETNGEILYPRVITIKQNYKFSLVDKVDDYEKYAYGIGLIYRQRVDLYSGDIDPGIPIEQRLLRGVSLFEELIEYGYEN